VKKPTGCSRTSSPAASTGGRIVTRLLAVGASATTVAALLEACGVVEDLHARGGQDRGARSAGRPDKMNEIGKSLSIYN
jgi:hypothetical protein